MTKYKAVLTTTAVVQIIVEVDADSQNDAIVEAMDAAANATAESMTIERVDKGFIELLTVTAAEQPTALLATKPTNPHPSSNGSSDFIFRRYSDLGGEGFFLGAVEGSCLQAQARGAAIEALGQAGSVAIWTKEGVFVETVSASRDGWEVEYESSSVPGAFLCYRTRVGSASRALSLVQTAKKEHAGCAIRISLLDPVRQKRNVWRVIP